VLRCEDPLGEARCHLAADLGRAGLEQHRVALRRPRDIQRAAYREMLALMVQVMQLARIEVPFRVAVPDKGIVVPAVPQSPHNFDKLDCPVVTGIVLIMLLASEVEGFGDVRRGDDIPPGTTAAYVVERGEFPGNVVVLLSHKIRDRVFIWIATARCSI
jgi:hypothetical protein